MPLTIQLKRKAYEYTLIRLTKWFIEEKRLQSLQEFNEVNDFGIAKVLLFPFFICTANGDREVLFNHFCHKIYPDENGLIDRDIATEIDNLENFQIGLFNCELKNIEELRLAHTKESILRILEAVNDDALFNEIIDAIDNSINCIRYELDYSDFVTLSWEELSSLCKEHNSWQVFSDPTILESQPEANIPSDFLIREKSPFAHDAKKRNFA